MSHDVLWYSKVSVILAAFSAKLQVANNYTIKVVHISFLFSNRYRSMCSREMKWRNVGNTQQKCCSKHSICSIQRIESMPNVAQNITNFNWNRRTCRHTPRRQQRLRLLLILFVRGWEQEARVIDTDGRCGGGGGCAKVCDITNYY